MIEALKERKLMKKLAAINRETVPGRVMFAKGAGARGVFQPYMTMSDYTEAAFLSDPERETPVFVRFSKASAEGGETGRDLRGFAVKFYTEEGNYDLIAGSMPVFYISDPMKIPALITALKKEKESNLSRPEMFWTFAAANPETIHMILRLYGNAGTVKSYRTMPGYSVATYRWVNQSGERFLARCRWAPLAGVKCITRQEGEFLAGFDGDAASRDLYETLKEGKTVEYELAVQLVPEEKQEDFSFSLTDATKLWPAEQIPYIRVGKLTLTDTAEDYLNEVEKAAFSPANLVKGIEFSADPLLSVMSFAMEDGQRHRLGAGYEQLPVNRCRKTSDDEIDGEEEVCAEENAKALKRKWKASVQDAYRQAGAYYRGLSEDEKRTLEDNIADEMMFVSEPLQKDMLRHFLQTDQELGKRIAKGLTF